MGNCLTTGGKGARPRESLEYDDSYTSGHGGHHGVPVEPEPQVWDAVSEKLPAAAAQGSRSVVDLIGGPGYLDVDLWTANLDIPVIKARATALENGIDAMLVPLLKGTEQQVASSSPLSWDQMEVDSLLGCLAAAARDNVPLEVVAETVHRLLGLMLAISKTAEANKLPAPQDVFQVASINRLMRYVAAITTREITLDTRERAMARWAQWRQLTSALGLGEDATALALNAVSRATLIFLQVPARAGTAHAILQVSREECFQQGCQLAQAQGHLDGAPGACLIFPSFASPLSPGQVESESGQGPRREFFRLSGQGMLTHRPDVSPDGSAKPGEAALPALFVHVPSANKLWFNTRLVDTPRLKEAYAYAGWLVGQQLSNCASLNIPLPELVFEKLLEGDRFKASIERLQEFDAAAAGGLRIVAAAGQLGEEDFRELLQVEGCPPSMSRATYVARAVHHHLVGAVEWQSAAFAQGFFRALPRPMLEHWRVTPADLAELSRGGLRNPASNFGFRRTFRICVQPDVPQPLAAALLEVLENMASPGKRAVVAFATGAGRAPPQETEVLRIGLAAPPPEHSHPEDLMRRLPQARTCDNMLEVPDYYTALLAQLATSRRLSLSSRPRISTLLSAVSPKGAKTPKGSTKTPRTPRTPGSARAAREVERRLHDVLSERLSLAVAECNSYDMPTRHALSHRGTAPVVVPHEAQAASATPADGQQAEAEEGNLQWPGSAKAPAPSEASDDSSAAAGDGSPPGRLSAATLLAARKRAQGPSRLATASFPSSPSAKAPSPRDKASPRKSKGAKGGKREALANGKTRIGVLADSGGSRQDSFEEVAEAPEEGAAPHSGAKDARGAKGAKGGGSLKVPQPDSPLDRSSSIAAVRP